MTEDAEQRRRITNDATETMLDIKFRIHEQEIRNAANKGDTLAKIIGVLYTYYKASKLNVFAANACENAIEKWLRMKGQQDMTAYETLALKIKPYERMLKADMERGELSALLVLYLDGLCKAPVGDPACMKLCDYALNEWIEKKVKGLRNEQ
jgi:uncharacterized iron-regulated protein